MVTTAKTAATGGEELNAVSDTRAATADDVVEQPGTTKLHTVGAKRKKGSRAAPELDLGPSRKHGLDTLTYPCG